MAARIAALVAAVAMVVAAVAFRSRIDHHDVTARLTCSTELAPVCAALGRDAGGGVKVEAKVEAAGATADRLTNLQPGADPGLDGWLVAGPWPEMVDAARQLRSVESLFGTTATSGPALAISRLAAVVEVERAKAVAAKCVGIDWTCLAGLFPQKWSGVGAGATLASFGPVKADVPDPATQAVGLAVLVAMSASAVKDGPITSSNADLLKVLRNVGAAGSKAGFDAVTTMLLSGGFAQIDVVTTTDAEAHAVIDSAANGKAVTVLYPSPVTTVDVELGTPGRMKAATTLAGALRGAAGSRALTAAGWQKPGSLGATNVADPGTLAGLRATWKDQ